MPTELGCKCYFCQLKGPPISATQLNVSTPLSLSSPSLSSSSPEIFYQYNHNFFIVAQVFLTSGADSPIRGTFFSKGNLRTNAIHMHTHSLRSKFWLDAFLKRRIMYPICVYFQAARNLQVVYLKCQECSRPPRLSSWWITWQLTLKVKQSEATLKWGDYQVIL